MLVGGEKSSGMANEKENLSHEDLENFIRDKVTEEVKLEAWSKFPAATVDDMPSADEWSCKNPDRMDPKTWEVSCYATTKTILHCWVESVLTLFRPCQKFKVFRDPMLLVEKLQYMWKSQEWKEAKNTEDLKTIVRTVFPGVWSYISQMCFPLHESPGFENPIVFVFVGWDIAPYTQNPSKNTAAERYEGPPCNKYNTLHHYICYLVLWFYKVESSSALFFICMTRRFVCTTL